MVFAVSLSSLSVLLVLATLAPASASANAIDLPNPLPPPVPTPFFLLNQITSTRTPPMDLRYSERTSSYVVILGFTAMFPLNIASFAIRSI